MKMLTNDSEDKARLSPMKRAFKVLGAISLGLVLGFMAVVLWALCHLEAYCVIYPAIDTQFTGGYTERGFDQISAGMTAGEVEKLIGKPMNVVTNVPEYNLEQFSMSQEEVHRLNIFPHIVGMSSPPPGDPDKPWTLPRFESEVWSYSSDGKCWFGDFAWLGRFVILSNRVVVQTNKRIFYD